MEKRNMWLVTSFLDIREIVAMYDTEADRVECYCFEDEYGSTSAEWYQQEEYEYIFATKGAAIYNRDQQIKEIKEMMPKVRGFIIRMENIEPIKGELEYKNEDYLDSHANSRTDWISEERNMYMNLFNRVTEAYKIGILNIDAVSVKISEVKRVKWLRTKVKEDGSAYYSYSATIYLNDGTTLSTHSKEDYKLVEALFGDNNSGEVCTIQ